MRCLRPALPVLLLCACARAADLGTWGDVYPVAEPDLLDTLRGRLAEMEKSGELARHQAALRDGIAARALRPDPVAGLGRAGAHRTHFADPTFTVPEDIVTPDGAVIARRGDRVNPLESLPFTQTLWFIDGDDPQQVAWVKRQAAAGAASKIILVKGSVREAGDALDARVYFDQQGALTRRFGLTAVPARVAAAPDGLRLQVDEYAEEELP
ncbi:type-F conjugative transfer system protein TraW [Pantoea sp. M_9]|uniref:type-F conjugative transfer system protein TraW n=1 Tax=Pantoea sp. M_9 TaxID=2608041 RepID=UPI001232D506|nr:type-F conjugative transfer system protein TraW [Pantoea sp. M_9]KAA5971648.1 type-F conjugative transfer system protein TraW [Pantoea sp. M_9]